MDMPLAAPLLFGLIAACVTTLGLFVIARHAAWSERYAGLFGLAAGGMLVTVILLHIAPDAFARHDNAAPFIFAGFLGALLLNQGLRTLRGRAAVTGEDMLAPLIAIAVHSFVDGVVYAVTFAASASSGLMAAGALILHEFPEGMIAFAILRRGGVSARRAFIGAFLAAAATTPLGVLMSGPVMTLVGPEGLASLFALSAGLLLFVATGPLLGPLREETRPQGLAAVCAGVALALVLVLVPGHTHGDGRPHADHARAGLDHAHGP